MMEGKEEREIEKDSFLLYHLHLRTIFFGGGSDLFENQPGNGK
jgi:hypothetical protein